MKNIIVTGGLGFIGSNLIELLLKKNFYIINIDKVSYSSNFYNVKNYNNTGKYKYIKCDIKEKRFKKILFEYKPICIFNLVNRQSRPQARSYDDFRKLELNDITSFEEYNLDFCNVIIKENDRFRAKIPRFQRNPNVFFIGKVK